MHFFGFTRLHLDVWVMSEELYEWPARSRSGS